MSICGKNPQAKKTVFTKNTHSRPRVLRMLNITHLSRRTAAVCGNRGDDKMAMLFTIIGAATIAAQLMRLFELMEHRR
jgi:hypothetical protein